MPSNSIALLWNNIPFNLNGTQEQMTPTQKMMYREQVASMTTEELTVAISLGISIGKMVWEEGHWDFRPWAVEMNKRDPRFRPVLKGIYMGLCTASQDPSVFTPAQQVVDADLDKMLGDPYLPIVPIENEKDSIVSPPSVDNTIPENQQELRKLLQEGLLTVRAFNVLKIAGLYTLEDARQYGETHQGFKHIKGCGNLTNKQLMLLAQVNAKPTVPQVTAPPDQFPVPDRRNLKRLFDIHYPQLSPNAKAHLTTMLPEVTSEAVYCYLVGLGKQFSIAPKTGKTIATELRRFRTRLVSAHRPAATHASSLSNSAQKRSTPKRRRRSGKTPPGLGGTGIFEALQRHQQPLHLRSLVRLSTSKNMLSTTELKAELKAGLHGPVVMLKDGFIGLVGRKYGTLPPVPISLEDSLYRKAIWTHFVGSPIQELCSYLLGCTTLAPKVLVKSLTLKMVAKGFYVDGAGNLQDRATWLAP